MTRDYKPCEVTLEFGDGEHLFKLPLKMIAELQEKCGGVGIGTIYRRVLTGDYRGEDLVETVRCGLIGGGLPGPDARKIIDRYCDTWPLDVWHQHAAAILTACIQGYEGDASPKKDQARGMPSSPSPMPTETALSSD
jgi:hypothetical protein